MPWLLAACLLLAGCRPAAHSAATVSLDWTVAPSPPVTGTATLSLTLTDAGSGQPLPGAEVRVEGDMTHPGMQPVFSTAREVAPGRYEAPVHFTMAGDWVLLVDGRLRDGRTFERQMAVPGVRAGRT
ncbi:MAG TPA: FixH family protein [Thermoanaerobaculia bacterium]|nr:FixH family protein [Thermoanaerobaculia bacterium]